MQINTETQPLYNTDNTDNLTDDLIIAQALAILETRCAPTTKISNRADLVDCARLRYGQLDIEVFAIVWLSTAHEIILFDEISKGTINAAAIYPREVAKNAIKYSASAAILFHNHPSGNCQPSSADKLITQKLKSALSLIDVTVLDHIIVSGCESYSFADYKLLL